MGLTKTEILCNICEEEGKNCETRLKNRQKLEPITQGLPSLNQLDINHYL